MKTQTPSYIREGRRIHIVESNLDAFGHLTFRILRTDEFKSVSKAKKHSAELQKGRMGDGSVRTMESLDRMEARRAITRAKNAAYQMKRG